MADRIDVDYDEMNRIAKSYSNEADSIAQLIVQTRSKVAGLHGNGWIGQGSEAFFAEMENMVLPSMDRLQKALTETSLRTLDVVKTFQNAEDEARSLFHVS